MRPIIDYVLSLHYAPAGASILLTCVTVALGGGWLLALAQLCLGAAVTAAAFYFQPLSFLVPMGGRFNAGICEVQGDHGSMKPPLTIVYPTIGATSRRGIQYLPFGDTLYLRGLARYIHLPYVLLKDLCFLRKKMRPAATPVPLLQADGSLRPIMLFSHGLGGFPHLYSSLMMDMAVRGAIVICMTHMDGSAGYCRDAGRDIHVSLNTKIRNATEDRAPQLEIRTRETQNTIRRIRSGEVLLALGYEKEVVSHYVSMDPPVHLFGHSFGGSTCITTALEEAHEAMERGESSCIGSVVAFDPWSIPMRKSMFYDKIRNAQKQYHYATPTLILFSEAWQRDKEQYPFWEDVKSIIAAQKLTAEEAAVVSAAEAKLKAINAPWYATKAYRGTGHLSCTDIHLFNPRIFRETFMKGSSRGSIVAYAYDTLQFVEKISGCIPIDTNLIDDPALAAALRF